MRIILDTNLWISFLISSKYNQLDSLLFEEKCTLLFSQELLEEFIAVAKRPKLRKYISREEREALLDTIDEIAEFITVTSNVDLCRDPKDNFLLSLALDGEADYLLTGDNDLLVLEKVGETKIMKIADFFDLKES
ncbi:MAG: putative toxin-antitoxin system toxin component, PIN family [Candidatus Paceibacterota bacterium]